ncbi:MAG: desulfoferrodoxin [Nanoarchaeota archaeon]|nr:desulfoferrodoxin [Nanoarchaeota archaeon]MBU1027621.1 desulfoferrodoxin [Nanoarchaeota archaeon]
MTTKKNQIYKCEICGNIVEVLHEGEGELVCCGQPMKLFEENTIDAATEKHVPVIEAKKVKIGSVAHPMEQEHYIEWIEVTSKTGTICKVFLQPGQAPETEFPFQPVSAREYCNLHGLWKSN